MSITMPETADTRARMLLAYRDGLVALVGDATQQVGDVRDDAGELAMNLGDWDGVPVVTRRRLDEAIRAIFGQPIPAPSETTVEVSTPATVYTSTTCPDCGIARVIPVSIRAELLISDDGSELRTKTKAKPVPHVCGQLPLEASDEAGETEQIGLLMAIESLVDRVHAKLEEVAALPGEEDGEEMPSIDTIRAWDRATIDQVDRWATARMANNGEHPESCSARFAQDATTGERVCDCGLAEAVPALPRVLGGEADPEPLEEPADDAEPEDDAGPGDCPYPGCDLQAEHEGDHDVVGAVEPDDAPSTDDDDDALLPD